MHCLEIIILRNAEAAGREAAHTNSRIETARAESARIFMAFGMRVANAELRAWDRGYARGQQEIYARGRQEG